MSKQNIIMFHAIGTGRERKKEKKNIIHSCLFSFISICFFFYFRWTSLHIELCSQFLVLISALLAIMSQSSLSAGLSGLLISYALWLTVKKLNKHEWIENKHEWIENKHEWKQNIIKNNHNHNWN